MRNHSKIDQSKSHSTHNILILPNWRISAFLFQAMTLMFCISPISNATIMKTCTKYGRLVRDNDSCRVLLPNREFALPRDRTKPHLQMCDDYYLIGGKHPEEFYAWKGFNQSISGFELFQCVAPENGTKIQCYENTTTLSKMIPGCDPKTVIIWFAFMKPDPRGTLAFAKCGTGKYYLKTGYYRGSQLNNLDTSMGYVVPGSLFYSMNLSHTNILSDTIYILPTSVMRDNDGLLMLSIDM